MMHPLVFGAVIYANSLLQAAPRHVPIHYISTIGVFPGESTDAVSAAAFTPPVDGSNGYVSSRWASEQILERSSASLGVPSSIYRFLPAAKLDSPKDVLDEFIRFVDISGIVPEMSDWEGRIDMIRADAAAKWLQDSITGSAIQFSHLESPAAVEVAALRNYISEQRGDRKLEAMPGLAWIGRIKALGFPYFLTSQQATVGGNVDGAAFESRR